MRINPTVHGWLTAVCGVLLVGAAILQSEPLALLSVAAGLPFALAAGYRSLARRSVDVNVLMVAAAIGAVILRHAIEAGILLFLFSLASTLEEYAMGRTRSAIEGLVKLRPKTALILVDGLEQTVPVEDLRRGDVVRILPFAQVPVDAAVVDGESSVDRSSLSGESQPVAVRAGDAVLAGTQNLEGLLSARVTAEAGATTLDAIVELVRQAQSEEGSGEHISNWFGQTYTVMVLVMSAVSFLVRNMMGQGTEVAAYGSLGLLVALSPCALVISTPASTLSALAWAARRGMLVRGGKIIESAGHVTSIGLDKTGTLTEGRPRLVELCVCGASTGVDASACWHGGPFGDEARRVLGLAAAVEQHATHPLAMAIVKAAAEQDCVLEPTSQVRVDPGLGVVAEVGGRTVRVGQPRYFEHLPEEFERLADDMRTAGKTVAIMEADGSFAALGLRDSTRQGTKEILSELRELGISRIALLTGDSERTAAAVASELGITEFRGGLLPQDKEAWVREAQSDGRAAIFVGDGVNDAPVLAAASVGVAMGGLGSDIAMNAAKVVLVNDDLGKVADLVRLGRKANRIIRTNLIFAGGMVCALAIMTFALEAFWPSLRNLTLPFAVVGHEGSTAIVVLNGLRLLRGP